MPDLLGGETALLERLLHGAADALAVGRGGRHVVGVTRGAVAGHLGDDAGAARERMLERLQHDRARALAGDEAAAAHVERQRGALRILGLGERAQVGEARDADRGDALLGAARERDVGVAVADVAQRGADAVGAGRARGHDVEALAFHAVTDRQRAGSDVADHRRDEQRVHALGALLDQRGEAALQLVDAADARAEHHGDARGILQLHVEAGHLEGLVGRHDGVLDEALEAARLLLAQPVLGGIEIANLAGDVHLVLVRVEALDRIDAAFLAVDGIPQRLDAHAGGRDGAHAGDDDAVRAVGTARLDARGIGGNRALQLESGLLAHNDIPPSMQITCPVM